MLHPLTLSYFSLFSYRPYLFPLLTSHPSVHHLPSFSSSHCQTFGPFTLDTLHIRIRYPWNTHAYVCHALHCYPRLHCPHHLMHHHRPIPFLAHTSSSSALHGIHPFRSSSPSVELAFVFDLSHPYWLRLSLFLYKSGDFWSSQSKRSRQLG